MIREVISQLTEGKSLSRTQAENVMDEVMTGSASPAQIAGFLVALRMKGETVEEITGCAAAMRRAALNVNPERSDLVDTCGTGGDGAGTFNISTTSAFVVAGAGLAVAKHGNRSVSSKSGSADVLEVLGVNLDLNAEQMAKCIDSVGIGFLFAPKLHPAMRYAIGPRKELGIRTIFNILGPLTNPAGAQTQLLGVYAPELTEMLALVLQSLGSKAACVTYGHGGLDELSTTGPNHVSLFGVNGGSRSVTTRILDPQDFNFSPSSLEELLGGTPEENAVTTRNILAGIDRGSKRDVVLLNSGMALYVGRKAATIQEGIDMAVKSIDNGHAIGKLSALVDLSNTFTKAESA